MMTERDLIQRARSDGELEALRDYFRALGWLDADALLRDLQARIDDAEEQRCMEWGGYGEPTPKVPVAKPLEVVARYVHLKRGTDYSVFGDAKLQCAPGTLIEEGHTFVVYRSEEIGQLFVRPTAEFHDGRFKGIGGDKAVQP